MLLGPLSLGGVDEPYLTKTDELPEPNLGVKVKAGKKIANEPKEESDAAETA